MSDSRSAPSKEAQAPRLYIRNVAPAWRKAVGTSQSRVLVFSPYLTSSKILRHPPHQLTVYTGFSLELFASGASSFRCLKEIMSWEDTEVYWLPSLHAKIVVVDDALITIGSQNMTARGERNLEATAIVESPEAVAKALQTLEGWMQHAIPITPSMLEQMEELLPPARKLYRAFKATIDEGEALLAAFMEAERRAQAEAERIALERKIQREEAWQRLRDAVKHVTAQLERNFPNNEVSEDIAKDFVADSAWWLTHRSGRPVSVPKMAEYVFWSQSLGYCWSNSGRYSNKYMVERAILMCKRRIKELFAEADVAEAPLTREQISNDLCGRLFRFVANCNDEIYRGEYGRRGNDIVFGAHSIDTKDFTNCFFYYCGIDEYLNAAEELQKLESEEDEEAHDA